MDSIIYILYAVNALLDCENVVGVFTSKEKAVAYLDNCSITYKYDGVDDTYNVSDDEYYYIVEACIDKGVYES